MKKTVRTVCLLLAGILFLLAVSCRREEGETANTGAAGTYTESVTPGTGDLYVVSGNRFRIVYGEGGAGGEKLNSAATLLYNLIWKTYGKQMELLGDQSGPAQEYEILIGDTDRDGNISTESLTYYDYGWSFDGTKVRIYGGSDEALENAVRRFTEKYHDAENKALVIPVGEQLTATYSYPLTAISLNSVEIGQYTVAGNYGFDAAADAVAVGFGRLCGVRMTVNHGKNGSAMPTDGRYIYVGYGETDDLNMLYNFEGGTLRFVGNGLTGCFIQMERLVEAFFETEFAGVTSGKIDLTTIKENKVMPVIEHMQYADSDFIAMLDRNFEATRDSILSAESEYEVSGNGKIYYVSSVSGDDSNDGLSEDRPWKTLKKVNETAVPAGSVILFKRGEMWNRQGRLYSKANVTFSAYGEGDKPLISNYIDASDESDWAKVGENLYVYSGSYRSSALSGDYNGNDVSADYPDDPSIPGSYLKSTEYGEDDVGNIIFNDDEGWGVKIMKKNQSNVSVAIGTVPTGFGSLTHNSISFADQRDLSQHMEFYHNSKESRLYLYCEGGNPATVFSKIKLVLEGYAFFGGTAEVSANVTVDNLAIKYWGCHGVSVNQCTNFTVRNCEIGWCGGSIQGYSWGGRDQPTRLGEGIQNWGNCNNFRILNNFIHQIYDGASSSQQAGDPGLTRVVMQNVEVNGNCYENNSSNIEFWMNLSPEQGGNENFKFKDWDISGNLIRSTGRGFGRTRPIEMGNNGGQVFADSMGWPKPMYENVKMSENTTWNSDVSLVDGLGWGTDRYNLEGNIFVQEYGTNLGHLAADFDSPAQWEFATYPYDTETIALLLEKKVLSDNSFYYTYNKQK